LGLVILLMPIVDVVMTINHSLSIHVTLPADEIHHGHFPPFIFIFVEFVAMQGQRSMDPTEDASLAVLQI